MTKYLFTKNKGVTHRFAVDEYQQISEYCLPLTIKTEKISNAVMKGSVSLPIEIVEKIIHQLFIQYINEKKFQQASKLVFTIRSYTKWFYKLFYGNNQGFILQRISSMFRFLKVIDEYLFPEFDDTASLEENELLFLKINVDKEAAFYPCDITRTSIGAVLMQRLTINTDFDYELFNGIIPNDLVYVEGYQDANSLWNVEQVISPMLLVKFMYEGKNFFTNSSKKAWTQFENLCRAAFGLEFKIVVLKTERLTFTCSLVPLIDN